MIETPWNLILTVVFTYTGAVCLLDLVGRLRSQRRAQWRRDGEVLVDINHLVMSAAMIWMSWSMESALALWAQVAVFAGLSIGLLLVLRRAERRNRRGDLLAHLTMNAAMIWMLAAMPLLMAEMAVEHHGQAGGHTPSSDGHAAMAATPVWADAVNVVFVVLSIAGAVWWLYRGAASARHRLHASCHAVMGAGMAAMLVLMN